MTMAEFRVNLILLATIFGVSAVLFFGRAVLTPSRETAVAVLETPLPVAPEAEKQLPPVAVSPSVTGVPGSIKTDTPVEAAPAANNTPVVTNPSKVKTSPTIKTSPTVKSPPGVSIKPASFSVTAPPPEKPVPVKHRGTLVFVFDDAGHNLKQLEPFLKLPFPCTIAVLPGLQYSKEAARMIRAAGKDVVLHQPMQAINLSFDPGPGAIRMGMTADEIQAVVRKNLAEIGPVVGINNHEGSLITADRLAMEAVLGVVREKGIYFLDSRTNSETIVPVIAREQDMTIWERAVFLDNIQERTMIIEAVNSGMKIAERKGAAIMIGHIWSNDLADILTKMYPELASQGFSLSTIAQIAISGDIDE